MRSLSIAVIFIAYAIHTNYQPFLDRLDLDIPVDSAAHTMREGAVLNYVFQYNKLESIFLVCSIVILLCGMVFESNFVRAGSALYGFFTWTVRALCCTLLLGVADARFLTTVTIACAKRTSAAASLERRQREPARAISSE